MDYRILSHIIAPFIFLLLIGTWLNYIEFKYIDQMVIAFGPIMAAFIALYIAKSSDAQNEKDKKINQNILLDHLLSLIEGGKKSIETERDNYELFIKELKEKGMEQVSLKTTPFFLLEEAKNSTDAKIFEAILNIENKNSKDLKDAYLAITTEVNNALFVKENSKSQYEIFISQYNIQASKLRAVMLELNSLLIACLNDPQANQGFNLNLSTLVYQFNEGVKNETINYYSTEHLRTYILNRIEDLIANTHPHYVYFPPLQKIYKELEVTLRKIDEIQEITSAHYSGMSKQLVTIEEKISEKIEIIKEPADNNR